MNAIYALSNEAMGAVSSSNHYNRRKMEMANCRIFNIINHQKQVLARKQKLPEVFNPVQIQNVQLPSIMEGKAGANSGLHASSGEQLVLKGIAKQPPPAPAL